MAKDSSTNAYSKEIIRQSDAPLTNDLTPNKCTKLRNELWEELEAPNLPCQVSITLLELDLQWESEIVFLTWICGELFIPIVLKNNNLWEKEKEVRNLRQLWEVLVSVLIANMEMLPSGDTVMVALNWA